MNTAERWVPISKAFYNRVYVLDAIVSDAPLRVPSQPVEIQEVRLDDLFFTVRRELFVCRCLSKSLIGRFV